MHMEEILIQKYTCTAMFTAALLTAVKALKQPNCPSTDEWMKKKMCHTDTMEHYSAIKRNEIESFAAS